MPLPALADALAPGIVLAQAIGRWGNWFNQELFGGPSDLPWAVEIDRQFRPERFADVETFHPTFLYESLWCIGVALVLIWADRRFRMGHGQVFALYDGPLHARPVWIEYLRVDPAREVLGLRLNVWTSVLVLVGAVVYIVISGTPSPRPRTPEKLRGAAAAAHPGIDDPPVPGDEPRPAQISRYPPRDSMPATRPRHRATSPRWGARTAAPISVLALRAAIRAYVPAFVQAEQSRAVVLRMRRAAARGLEES